MWSILSFAQKKLSFSIPIMMVLGWLYGSAFSLTGLKELVMPLTFMMVYPMMISMNFAKIVEKGDSTLQLSTQAINFLIIPFVALLIAKLTLTNPYQQVGLLLAALLPTSGMTISWTGFAKGNMSAAIKMTIVGLVMGSLLTPFYIKIFLKTEIEVPLFQVLNQILIVVFLPMMMGAATRKTLMAKWGSAKFENNKEKFKLLSTVGVLGIVFVAMALKSRTILAAPLELLKLFYPLMLLYGFNFIVSTLIARKYFNYQDGAALIFGSVMRNLSIALVIALSVFGEKGSEVALVITLAYIIQVQAGAWYVKIITRVLKEDTPAIANWSSH